jgi:hypothetical protein
LASELRPGDPVQSDLFIVESLESAPPASGGPESSTHDGTSARAYRSFAAGIDGSAQGLVFKSLD